MKRALALAERGVGRTSPNPAVGCVIVRARDSDDDSNILGAGYHVRAGEAHGEVAALRDAAARGNADDLRGATAFVTLEPCNHTGRTGPCTEALLAAGIGSVVCALLDPNPKVAGSGVARLRAGGITVEVGVLADDARRVHRAYLKWMRTGLPLVTLKAATSLDGRIATASGDSKWLSNPASRRRAHEARNRHDAILVGVGTIIADDPALTTRLGEEEPGQRDAQRVIVDGGLRTPPTARATRGALIFGRQDADPLRQKILTEAGAEVVRLPGESRVALAAVLAELGRRSILTVLVEGGSSIHGQLVADGLADRLLWFVTPRILGSDARPAFDWHGPATVAAAPRLFRVLHSTMTSLDPNDASDVLIEGDFFEQLH